MWAVVPIKDFKDAKERLSHILSLQERQSLAQAMAEDVLRALLNVPALAGIAVATRDAEAQELCTRLGVRILTEKQNEGQTTAVVSASQTLRDEGVGDVLTIPGDVPLVLPQDIRSVMAAHGAAPAMTIVPARDHQGSNCVVLSPPGCVPLRFGDNSFYPHLDAARQVGIKPLTVELPNLALDIDSPDDLEVLVREPVRTRAQEFLVATGIVGRFGQLMNDLPTDAETASVAAGGAE